MTDDKTFFHQATMKICGSLDTDKVVRKCAGYLSAYIPLEGLMLSTYEPEKGAIRILALSATVSTAPWDKPIYLSAEAQAILAEMEQGVSLRRQAENDPIAHEFSHALGIAPFPTIVLHLKLDEKKLGVVIVFSTNENAFTDEHIRLMGLLHDPFAVAMANVLRHRELLRLKDLLADDNRYLQQELRYLSGDEIIGARYGLRNVMEMVRQVAPLASHVMLTGETGVGKEVIANAIHYTSSRRDGPLVKVNCGAFAENLLDSELFGHEKGAFTGAIRTKRGRFERAHGGTLFLDEVGELPAAAQVRLLRVLQDGLVERIGGLEPIEVDVRIIAATHRDLTKMVKDGSFREDLWFRLNVFPIHIPPLRQRKSDIPALVHHFIDRKLKNFNLYEHPVLAPGEIERLSTYAWPGNVRELGNMVERALIRHQSGGLNPPLCFDDLKTDSSDTSPPPLAEPPPNRLLTLTLDEVMRRHIEAVLRLTNGKIQGKDGAAAILNVHSSTLRSRMNKLGVSFGRRRVIQ
ncbi:ATPase AAA [Desulfosarcina ovata subsp. sediminis]|uniref:ATPase AAA n=1 Tax=Desulfosarcina ovata subsp. sediminis TaxID=885957 RepID=A0A5K7ZLW7_9BACT|nr:sigma 54-interacting transcriptional regulator [Desulfosarcina ovata]BBO81057.1 ATPase AAA [Desulfosarcina ovata subsp. sediminis]